MAKTQMSEELKALKRIELLLETMAKTVVAKKLAKILKEKKHAFLYENTGHLPRPTRKENRLFRGQDLGPLESVGARGAPCEGRKELPPRVLVPRPFRINEEILWRRTTTMW